MINRKQNYSLLSQSERLHFTGWPPNKIKPSQASYQSGKLTLLVIRVISPGAKFRYLKIKYGIFKIRANSLLSSFLWRKAVLAKFVQRIKAYYLVAAHCNKSF